MIWGGYGGPCGLAWWGFGLAGLVLLGVGVYVLVRASESRHRAEDKALALLRERYARGEPDEETYRRIKKTLEE